ncbi:Protoporphyrinogen oxidase, partial [Amniculicola lignicola CBS 123094]
KSRRGNSSTKNEPPNSIAVIGGGITGLATTFYAAQRFPSAKVTLFESTGRLGGAIQSETINLANGERAVCEMGPRTLRANAPRAAVTFGLIQKLGLEADVVKTYKSDPIASHRYIYYPDHLVRIPVANTSKSVAHVPAPDRFSSTSFWCLIKTLGREPLFRGLAVGIMRGLCIGPANENLGDESIDSFLTRRLGKQITKNLFSAVIHGLYAGDMSKLSARALLPGMWTLDKQLLNDGVLKTLLSRDSKDFQEKWAANETEFLNRVRQDSTHSLAKQFDTVGVFSFRGGVARLTERLEEILQTMQNVAIKMNTKIRLLTDDWSSHTFVTHTISTLSLSRTMNLFSTSPPLFTPSHVPVMAVTLCYATPALNHPHRGFGYLFPTSLPPGQNAEHALGVIFDSDALPPIDKFTGTKITVMLGGHYWSHHAPSSLPSTESGIAMAMSLLKRQLGISEEPVAAVARLEVEAIPQYAVDHFTILGDAHKVLSQFGGKVRVAGNSYGGIGVHDCLFSAR